METVKQHKDTTTSLSRKSKVLRKASLRMLAGGRVTAICTVFFLLVAWARAEEGKNILDNGGFEEAGQPAPYAGMPKAIYDTLISRNVVFPFDAEELPMSVWLNPAARGWNDSQYVFEYLKGKPGEEVHTGERAIQITSPEVDSSVILGKAIPVVKKDDNGDEAIQVGRSYKYSFYAKGDGEVIPLLYMYDAVKDGTNLYDYRTRQTFAPGEHRVIEGANWQEYNGSFTLNSEDVLSVKFVLRVKGRVAIDDVQVSP